MHTVAVFIYSIIILKLLRRVNSLILLRDLGAQVEESN